jgi:hypothetical protein
VEEAAHQRDISVDVKRDHHRTGLRERPQQPLMDVEMHMRCIFAQRTDRLSLFKHDVPVLDAAEKHIIRDESVLKLNMTENRHHP